MGNQVIINEGDQNQLFISTNTSNITGNVYTNEVVVNQPSSNTIEVVTRGPQGAQGTLLPSNTGSFSVSGSLTITGSLNVTGSTNFVGPVTANVTGSLLGTASFANYATSASYSISSSQAFSASYAVSGTYASRATSASYALSSSYALSASYALSSSQAFSSSYATSGSYSSFASSASYAQSSSYTSFASSASYAVSASYSLSSSAAVSASYARSGSYASFASSASYAQSGSYSSFASSASYALSSSAATTASYAFSSSQSDRTISASFANNIASGLDITANSLNVVGAITASSITAISASFAYVESVTGSAVIIGQEYIILNTQSPSARFAGLKVYDSGSNHTGSLFWDSQRNHWIYENEDGATYSGGGLISGPRNTGSIGDESYPTFNRLVRGQGGDHIYDSNITDNDTVVSFAIPVNVTGSVRANSFTGSFSGSIVAPGSTTQILINSGSLVAANPNFVYSGSRLGINTSTPKAFAHVTQYDPTLPALPAGYQFLISNQGQYLVDNSGSYLVGIDSIDYSNASFIVDSAPYSNVIFVTGQSVGINTGTPNSGSLHVNGNVYANSFTGSLSGTATNAISSSYALSASYAENATNAVNATSASHAINANNAISSSYALSASYADSASYVSGTIVAPGSNYDFPQNIGGILSSVGALNIENVTGNAVVKIGQGIGASSLSFVGPNGTFLTTNGPTGVYRFTQGSQYIELNDTDGTLRLAAGGNVITTVDSLSQSMGVGITTPTARLHVKGTGTTDATTGLRIENANTSASLVVLDDGNVGIGTTSPAGKLDVRAGSGGKIILGSFDANYNATFEGGDQFNFYNGASATTGYINYNGPGNILLSRNLYVEGNPSGGTTGAVRIKSDGSVGIVTTTPSASLHISGASSANLLRIESPASSNILFVSGSGNVGIGTTSPSTKLEIANSTSVAGVKITTTSGNETWFEAINGAGQYGRFGVATSGHAFFNTDSSGYRFLTNASGDVVRITSGGNVGIGETSPTARLEVRGSGATSSTTALRVENANQSSSMVVLDDGNVGIGTATPASRLTVFGGTTTLLGAGGASNTIVEIIQNTGSVAGARFVGTGNDTMFELQRTSDGLTQTRLTPVGNSFINALSGNLGIGTTLPSSSLHISSSTSNTLFRITSGSNNIVNVGSSSVTFFSSTGAPTSGFDVDIQGSAPNAGTMRVAGSGTVYSLASQGSITRSGTGNPEMFGMVMGGTSTNTIQNTLRVQFDATQNATSGSGYTVLRLNATHASTAGTGSKLLQTWEFGGVAQSVMNISGSLGLGLTTPSASLHISGASTSTLLRVQSPTTANILLVSGSGFIGLNRAPGVRLDVSGDIRSDSVVYTSQLQATTIRINSATHLPFQNTGSGETARYDNSGNWAIGVGTFGSARLHVRGAGATSATDSFLVQNATPVNLLEIQDNGQFVFSGPLLSLASSQSAFSISQSISQSATVGAQVYGVNITPTFFATTASQTETAFRVNATFTGSAAATGSTNIIADFGAVSAGSQLTITDVTSGSIYMVNDVSGLPIVEATSDWTFNLYNYPNIVLQKTGSNVNITGSLRVTGSLVMAPTSSFVFPLTSSVAPPTGSAYWSGSFLFVYNGTRYMSASFV